MHSMKAVMLAVVALLAIPVVAAFPEQDALPGLDAALDNLSGDSRTCLECHAAKEPGRVGDWLKSRHASRGVSCIVCHKAKTDDPDATDCPGTKNNAALKITPIVTPNDCGRCHGDKQEEFARSKHARTWEIQTDFIRDPWLRGMTSDIERETGCYQCHGSDLSGGITTGSWPNEGCGRINPDGSLGTCAMCHTFHRFSKAEARKPDTCGQCHLGPDHPQNEIYYESKHGKRYLSESTEWDFTPDSGDWRPGRDFTAPTCAVCHMSGVSGLETTHDVGERLKWEAQAPLTVTNRDHDGDEERAKMTTVCANCHSSRWTEGHFDRYDRAVIHYNDNYFAPVKKRMDALYTAGTLTRWPMFDEEIEWVFYEFWHNEGRRARMGSAMMGPDYAWWHGFYDLKRSWREFMLLADEVEHDGHGTPVYVPGSGGKNLTNEDTPTLPGGWDTVPRLRGTPDSPK